jgi:predicted negative regulator of RcsB-dependent stress response
MADSFSKQLDKIYTETQKQTRDAQNRILYDMSWIDTMLNWFIIAALVLAIGVVGYRLYQKYQYYYGKQTPVELAL